MKQLENTSINYSLGTSAHAQKGRGLHEEVLKMLNCGTVCRFDQFSIRNPTQFSRIFGAKTSLTVVYVCERKCVKAARHYGNARCFFCVFSKKLQFVRINSIYSIQVTLR